MALSIVADWAAIISTILAAGATTFAGWEVFKSREERKQDLRFMYAQRAVMLNDIIGKEYEVINEIDEQLAFHQHSERHLALLEKLPIKNLLHEAKISESLASACNLKSPARDLVRYFEMLDWMDMQ